MSNQKIHNLTRFIYKTLINLLIFVFQRDVNLYYGRFYGTDNKVILFFKNLLKPIRFTKKILYRQTFKIPYFLSLSEKTHEPKRLNKNWVKYLSLLKRDGIVEIDNYFPKQAIEAMKDLLPDINSIKKTNKYNRLKIDINNPHFFEILLDTSLISIISEYYDCQPFLRYAPYINCTYPDKNLVKNSNGFNDWWHYDTVNQVTVHVLLSDLTEKDTSMLYAIKSHKSNREFLNADKDYLYSEEYVKDNYKIIPCIGKAGKIFIFDPNGLHRANPVENSFRSHIHINFVPGNDIVVNNPLAKKTDISPKTYENIRKLKKYQRDVLKYVLPK